MIDAIYDNITRLPIFVTLIHLACVVTIMATHYSVTHSSSSQDTLLFLIHNSIFISSFTSVLMLFLGPYYFLMYKEDALFEKTLVAIAFITSVSYFILD